MADTLTIFMDGALSFRGVCLLSHDRIALAVNQRRLSSGMDELITLAWTSVGRDTWQLVAGSI